MILSLEQPLPHSPHLKKKKKVYVSHFISDMCVCFSKVEKEDRRIREATSYCEYLQPFPASL